MNKRLKKGYKVTQITYNLPWRHRYSSVHHKYQ